MSHFTVLVVGENPEAQLAPYCEDTSDMDRDLLEFEDMEDEIKKEWDSVETFNSDYCREKHPEKVGKKPSEVFASIEEFADLWHGRKGRDGYMGRYGYWFNPDAKWDWYSLGGRWTGYFKLKAEKVGAGVTGEPGVMTEPNTNPQFADQARKGDIDVEGVKQEIYQKRLETWKKIHEDQTIDEGARNLFYGVKEGDTAESYAKRGAKFSTFAVLKDGEWYERGSMGWWGIVSDEKDEDKWEEEFESLIAGLPDDTLLSLYDCHI